MNKIHKKCKRIIDYPKKKKAIKETMQQGGGVLVLKVSKQFVNNFTTFYESYI